MIGISGVSGSIYGIRMLPALHEFPVETHLVMTLIAEVTHWRTLGVDVS